MALQVNGLKRIFHYKSRTGTITLDDPNPELNLQEVINHYSGMYPELINCNVDGPKLTQEAQEFTFSSTVGVKG
ncbi:MAG: PRTRC system protein C [Bacteroidota bacterium]